LLAAERLRALNPEVDIRPYVERIDARSLLALGGTYDILVDCSDNFATRFALNDVAMRLGKPAVVASVYQYEGQLQVIRPGGTCLRCIWPQATQDGLVGNCAEAGVLGPVPGALGSLQALEVLKLILGLPSPATDAIILVDLLTLEIRRLAADRSAECVAGGCARLPELTADEGEPLELKARPLDIYVDDGFILIDLRDAEERTTHPLNAVHRHIPFSTLVAEPHQLAMGERYLLLCARGQRSLAATRILREAGITTAWSMQGGLDATQ
jgi:adenylyltransferase/sulfurtransferase